MKNKFHRDPLFFCTLLALASLSWAAPSSLSLPPSAFQAHRLSELTSVLGKPTENPKLVFNIPQYAENGGNIPVEFGADPQYPQADTLTLIVEKNPLPLTANLTFGPGALPYFRTQIKMAESSKVRAYARSSQAPDRGQMIIKDVRVTQGGCGNSDDPGIPQSGPSRIRAILINNEVDFKVRMQHPMESGLRKSSSSRQTIPAHYIQKFTVSAGGKVLIDGQINTSIATNPLFAFRLKALPIGEKITVSWTDNKGEQRSDETLVSQAEK